jgi:hypothetical protein
MNTTNTNTSLLLHSLHYATRLLVQRQFCRCQCKCNLLLLHYCILCITKVLRLTLQRDASAIASVSSSSHKLLCT